MDNRVTLSFERKEMLKIAHRPSFLLSMHQEKFNQSQISTKVERIDQLQMVTEEIGQTINIRGYLSETKN